MQTLWFQIQTGLLISDFNPWRHKERERQFLKANANHTMLTPPQCTEHLVMFMISVHLCRSKSEEFNCTPQWSNLNYCLFKILKFSGPSLLDMTSSTLQPHFLLGIYYDKWWLSYPFHMVVRLHQMTMHLDKDIWVVQSLTKLNDKI